MKYYAIAPFNHLDIISECSNHMIISPFLEQKKKYREFYLKHLHGKSRVLLDNGLIELGKADAKLMMKWREILEGETGCHITVIAPDVWKNESATIEHVRKFMLEYGQYTTAPIMAVPHGVTIMQFAECLDILMGDELVKIIGLPYREWNDPLGWTRAFFVRNQFGPSNWEKQSVHLLGLWSVPELLMHRMHSSVVSVDSSLPFRLAKNGQGLNWNSVNTETFDWTMKLTKGQQLIAATNVQVLSKIAAENVKNGGLVLDPFHKNFRVEFTRMRSDRDD